MNIGIIPSIRETYKNQFEYSIDINLIKFIKTCFKKSKISIINNNKLDKLNFLIISGGNDLFYLNKKKVIY